MIIELMLPNSSMKKYINMVVGLLLILIFLQPLFHLFQVDIEDVMTQAVPSLEVGEEQENMKNLIESKKNEIQASQDAYVLEEMAVQMKNQVEEELNNDYGVSVVDLNFQFEEKEQVDLENLQAIKVLLQQIELDQQTDDDEATVEEVHAVDIEIGEQNQTQDELAPKTEKIKSYLSETWQLDEQDITIRWEGRL